MSNRITLRVTDPGCWYWVDAATTPVQRDPDADDVADSGLEVWPVRDWIGIAVAVRWLVQRAQEASDWDVRSAEVRLSHELSDDDLLIVQDWVRARPPASVFLTGTGDPFVLEGRHRLWFAGQAGIWPLPVMSMELQDLVAGEYSFDELRPRLEALRDSVAGSPEGMRSNTRYLANVERALTGAEPRWRSTQGC